jgi:hypothetical protein
MFDENEKRALFNFMSGYWDQSRGDINTLIELCNVIQTTILNKPTWPSELISSGIDAVAIGCSNNKHLFESDKETKSKISENLRLFIEYLSNISDDYLDHRQSVIKLMNEVIE